MKLVYDGPSLPMIQVHNQTYRLQRLFGGMWETIKSEGVYKMLFPELAAEASGNVPETSKETSSGEGGSSPTPSLQIPAEDIQKIINLFRQGEIQQQMPYMLRCAMHTAANVLEAYLKEGNATT